MVVLAPMMRGGSTCGWVVAGDMARVGGGVHFGIKKGGVQREDGEEKGERVGSVRRSCCMYIQHRRTVYIRTHAHSRQRQQLAGRPASRPHYWPMSGWSSQHGGDRREGDGGGGGGGDGEEEEEEEEEDEGQCKSCYDKLEY